MRRCRAAGVRYQTVHLASRTQDEHWQRLFAAATHCDTPMHTHAQSVASSMIQFRGLLQRDARALLDCTWAQRRAARCASSAVARRVTHSMTCKRPDRSKCALRCGPSVYHACARQQVRSQRRKRRRKAVQGSLCTLAQAHRQRTNRFSMHTKLAKRPSHAHRTGTVAPQARRPRVNPSFYATC